MNTLTRLALACVSLCLPFAVFAAAPDSVTGIKATIQEGKVLVVWTPITTQHISAYRVFFSHASILSNNGLYDDYDTVDGSLNSYTIPNTPQSDTVYVSVLAVNDQGEESPYFAEEASVKLSGGNTSMTPAISSAAMSSASAASTSSTMNTPTGTPETTLSLLSVRTLSATGVELTFSQSVTIDPALALNTITIQSASGTLLTITRLSVQGTRVDLDTLPQTQNAVYALIIGQGISGTDPTTNAPTSLDPAQAPVLFAGDPSGLPAFVPSTASSSSESSAAMSSASSLPHTDLTNLMIRAQAESKKGFYTIQATWQAPNDPTLAGFRVSQSTDRGLTYGNAQTLDRTTGGVSIPHVPAGSFSLLVRAIYTDGQLSSGSQKMVDLPGTAPTSTLPGSVIGQTGTSGHLSQSGPGMASVALMLGAAAGYAYMKRRQNALA